MFRLLLALLVISFMGRDICSVHVVADCDQSVTGNTSLLLADDGIVCAPWHYVSPSDGKCKCCAMRDAIKCTDEGTLLKFGYCTTYKEGEGVFMARCPYFLVKGHMVSKNEPRYIKLTNNVSQLNDYMCGPMNRKGFLCSECIDGFGPSVTSFEYMSCSNCTNVWYGIPLYILIEFLPVTIFYLTLLVFQIKVTSSPMTCFVLYSQLVMFETSPIGRCLSFDKLWFQNKYVQVITFSLYGVWNLDFLHYSFPPFCVSRRLSQSHIIFLGYASVIYPLCLIFLTWVLVELHGRNVRPLVLLWKPFHRCFVRLRRGWNTKSDIIDVFATFFLLSYSKLMYQLYSLFECTKVYTINSSSEKVYVSEVLPYTGLRFTCISNHHFLLLVVLSIIVMTLLPAFLLILYPVKLFRVCLSRCRLDHASISIFVDKFHSCYRDGLDGGRDMRSFSGLYFILRYILCFMSPLFSNYFHIFSSSFTFIIFTFFSTTVLIALVKPYRNTYMNTFDTLLLSLTAVVYYLLSTEYTPTQGVIVNVIILLPASVFWSYYILTILLKLCKNAKQCCPGTHKQGILLTQTGTDYGTAP